MLRQINPDRYSSVYCGSSIKNTVTVREHDECTYNLHTAFPNTLSILYGMNQII